MTPYPSDFLFGVSTSSYQIEGSLNYGKWPKNNWFSWDKKRGEPYGWSCNFWENPFPFLDLAKSLKVQSFRLSLEWARLKPKANHEMDEQALKGYGRILLEIYKRKMIPLITLYHFTHPLWLGLHPWLSERGEKAYLEYVDQTVLRIGRYLSDQGYPPPSFWLTINEPNALVLATHLAGAFPHYPRQKGFSYCHISMANLLKAHILAYRRIHEIYQKENWPTPKVSFIKENCYPSE